ncbi:bifunctional chorismate mutase/prephenate dehydratase [Romboutsia sp.]|uniref:bifunctional chorismate mutase/prephenate dehydratase n=1 Tax=Romboutsia sp. TaxID=1965302 RepID=UPI003F34980F
MDYNLSNLRDSIDNIDSQIIKLFEARMETSLKIAKYKKENNLPIFNKSREDEVIKNNIEKVKNKELIKHTEDLLKCLMKESKKYQYNKTNLKEIPLSKGEILKIGFQGTKGSYSEEALIEYFGEEHELFNYEKFEGVFEALKYKYIDYGVLPIENTSTGSISQIYDLLKKYGYYIVGETKIKVEHYLLGVKGARILDIEEIYSHHQGFEQSSDFLNTLPSCKMIPYYNTAISAKYVKDCNDTSKACVCSKRAKKIYDLEVLKPNINNVKENYTRFIIVGRELENNEICNKMTVVFSVGHKPGTLYRQLETFEKENINMLKIESRPFGDGSFCYFFYVDIEGNLEDENVKIALDIIGQNSLEFKILGCYKKN